MIALTSFRKLFYLKRCKPDLINALVMLSEAKHLWLGRDEMIRDSSLRSE
jgi:hypothetical protein